MPHATAYLSGNFLAPKLNGKVDFYPWLKGTLIVIEVANLPPTKPVENDNRPIGPFAFHIHEGTTCGDFNSNFEEAKDHYNPSNDPHAFHAGDLPSLISNDGYAYMTVYSDRFKLDDVIGRTVIIHLHPDDYQTQPSGNAGDRIACGIITKK